MIRPGVVLVGHGSMRVESAGAPLLALAESLRAECASVAVRFLRQEPRLDPADPMLTADHWVVPVLIGGGGLMAELAGRVGPARLTAPVGTHPGFATLVAAQAVAAAAGAGIDPAAAVLLLIAHGARQANGAAQPAQELAERLSVSRRFRRVMALFLEQEPRAAAWADHVGDGPVVVVPLLLSAGGHVRTDLPALFVGGEVVLASPPTDLAAIVRDLLGLPPKPARGDAPDPLLF